MKDKYKGSIPTDRIMTHLEVERAAMNIKEVERRVESKGTDLIEWLILAPGIIIVLLGIISSFVS